MLLVLLVLLALPQACLVRQLALLLLLLPCSLLALPQLPCLPQVLLLPCLLQVLVERQPSSQRPRSSSGGSIGGSLR